MKNNKRSTSSGSNLQARLVFIFSIVFVFCVAALMLFLYNIVRMTDYNNQASDIFEQNRQIYQLEVMLKNYELGIVQYEIANSPSAVDVMTARSRRIDETLDDLALILSADFQATVKEMIETKALLDAGTAEIIAVVNDESSKEQDQQNWSNVLVLDEQVAGLFSSMYDNARSIRDAGKDRLDTIEAQGRTLNDVAIFSGLIAIGGFVILVLVSGVIIYRQINLPVAQLTLAANELAERKFDPASLQDMASRTDELGSMARDFLVMAQAVEDRTIQLQQEADEIRAKIR